MSDSLANIVRDAIEVARAARAWRGRPMAKTRFIDEVWLYGEYGAINAWRLQKRRKPNLKLFEPWFRRLLALCPEEARDGFANRWELLNMQLADAIPPTADDRPNWEALARALVHTGQWPPGPNTVELVIGQCVDAVRQERDEQHALRNALILLRAAFAARNTNSRDGLYALLSVVVAALEFAGVLGHGPSLLLIQRYLHALHQEHPKNPPLSQLRFDCDAIVRAHLGPGTREALRDAAATHYQEVLIVEGLKNDRAYADTWSLIYRAGLGAHYNFMNMKVALGEVSEEQNDFYKRFRDTTTQIKMNSRQRAYEQDDGRTGMDPDRDPFLARLRMDIVLRREERGRSLVGGQPHRAIEIADRVLDAHAERPYLSLVEQASLRTLRAEALLCVWNSTRTVGAWDAYVETKSAAVSAARAGFPPGSKPRHVVRLRRLERQALARRSG